MCRHLPLNVFGSWLVPFSESSTAGTVVLLVSFSRQHCVLSRTNILVEDTKSYFVPASAVSIEDL